tara:strand:+ start:450 stop:620 length:171 start_codon:yes stop_codon:yes gene_type:complete
MTDNDIRQIAYKSGLLHEGENECRRQAFLTTFSTNLRREIEEEREEEERRRDRWED